MDETLKTGILAKIPSLETYAGQLEDSFVESCLQKRLAETGTNSVEAYLGYIYENRNEIHTLEKMLLNGYSAFFRNPLTFSVLEKIVLPSLIADKISHMKELRIWSTACASGQEPYSMAMLLEENENISNESFRYRIFASDKSKSQIKLAQLGCYSAYSLGQVSMQRLSMWFEKDPAGSSHNVYHIDNKLKKNIDFSVFDLLDPNISVPPSSIYGHFDMIFCTNLLFYYKPFYRQQIIEKTLNAMTSNGLLIVGEAERDLLKQNGLTEIFYRSAIFRK